MNYKPENFDFIQCEFTRKMVASACMALDSEDWMFLKYYYMSDNDSYMFSNNRRVLDIMNKVQDAYNGGHSGSSIGLTMRIVDRIAKRGLIEYQKQYMAERTDASSNKLPPRIIPSDSGGGATSVIRSYNDTKQLSQKCKVEYTSPTESTGPTGPTGCVISNNIEKMNKDRMNHLIASSDEDYIFYES